MTHDERWQLAQALCERMAAKIGDSLRVGGVYGSTARNTDTDWSDLELFFVVRSQHHEAAGHFIFRGIAVGYRAVWQDALETLLANPSRRWMFHMAVLNELKILHGDAEQVLAWIRMGESVPSERFRVALENLLPDLVTESHGRVLSCKTRQNTRDIWPAAWEILIEMNAALCLLNTRWVAHDYYQGMADTFSFPKLPEDYHTLVPALWDAREIDEIVPLANRLVRNFWVLLRQEGIRTTDYQRVDDVPL